MRRTGLGCAVVGIGLAVGLTAWAQAPVPSPVAPEATVGTNSTPVPDSATQAVPAVTGGKLHGQVKSGSTPLPGVTVTAQN